MQLGMSIMWDLGVPVRWSNAPTAPVVVADPSWVISTTTCATGVDVQTHLPVSCLACSRLPCRPPFAVNSTSTPSSFDECQLLWWMVQEVTQREN